MAMTDFQGGEGNGLAWYCNDFNAPVLMTSIYADFENKALGALNPQDVKDAIAAITPSAQNAPVLNYLNWVLAMCVSIA